MQCYALIMRFIQIAIEISTVCSRIVLQKDLRENKDLREKKERELCCRSSSSNRVREISAKTRQRVLSCQECRKQF
jgi:hypothetical protein